MKAVRLNLGERSYDIRIGAGILSQTSQWLGELGFSGKLVIITDPTVKRLHGDRLAATLSEDDFKAITLQVPEGEAQKSLDNAGRLYHELTNALADRSTPILALGGGVIGDLAGFVAATYMRGVPFIQVPTTLLAQVDASIGGKVAVNHGELKNQIGTFYQPRLVISDIDVLRTLPAEELLTGMAEAIKSAAVRSGDFFSYLEKHIGLGSLSAPIIEEVVYQSARIKAEIVEKDEKDAGLRHILNFGHTIGHGIEAASGFRVKHGQAVAIGMAFAARISSQMELLSDHDLSRLIALIEQAGLPTRMPEGLKLNAVLEAISHDKKVVAEKLRLVLLETIGRAVVLEGVSPDIVHQAVIANE